MGFLVFLILLALGYGVGRVAERRHFEAMEAREQALQHQITATLRNYPPDWEVLGSKLVFGSVVVAQDYFKSFVALFKMIVGGELTSFETLLERGRREALLRMREQAAAEGYNVVINIRLETSRIGGQSGNGMGGVEVLAFGTALRRRVL